MDSEKRVDGFDGKIRPAGDEKPGVQKPAPGVAAFGPPCPDPGFGEPHVGYGMDGLHRGNDAQLGETFDIPPLDELGVFDAEAVIGIRMLRQSPGVGLETQPVAADADAVGVDGHLGLQGGPGDLINIFRRHPEKPRVSGIVVVRLEKGRPPRTQGAVEVELDAADGQKVAPAVVFDPVTPEKIGQVRSDRKVHLFAEHGVDPERQAVLVDQAFVKRESPGPDARFVNAGEARIEAGFDGQKKLFPEPLIRIRRNEVLDKIHSPVDENSGRLAPGLADDDATRRIGSRVIDPGDLLRLAVGERGVAVDPNEKDGVIRRYGAQFVMNGKGSVGPGVLIPATADDPFAGGGGADTSGDEVDDLIEALRSRDVERGQRVAQAVKMGVSIDKPRQNKMPLKIENGRCLADPGRDLLAGADGGDAVAPDGHRFGQRKPGIHRGHNASDEDKIGRRGRFSAAAAQGQSGRKN